MLAAGQKYWVVVTAAGSDTLMSWYSNNQGLGGGKYLIGEAYPGVVWSSGSGNEPAFNVLGVGESSQPGFTDFGYTHGEIERIFGLNFLLRLSRVQTGTP